MPAGLRALFAVMHIGVFPAFFCAFKAHILAGFAQKLEVIGTDRQDLCSSQAKH